MSSARSFTPNLRGGRMNSAVEQVKKAIRGTVLNSYPNGLKAAPEGNVKGVRHGG